MGRMSVDLTESFPNLPNAYPIRDQLLLLLYRAATYVTFYVIDDAAMLAFAFS